MSRHVLTGDRDAIRCCLRSAPLSRSGGAFLCDWMSVKPACFVATCACAKLCRRKPGGGGSSWPGCVENAETCGDRYGLVALAPISIVPELWMFRDPPESGAKFGRIHRYGLAGEVANPPPNAEPHRWFLSEIRPNPPCGGQHSEAKTPCRTCGAGAGRHHYPRLKGLWRSVEAFDAHADCSAPAA